MIALDPRDRRGSPRPWGLVVGQCCFVAVAAVTAPGCCPRPTLSLTFAPHIDATDEGVRRESLDAEALRTEQSSFAYVQQRVRKATCSGRDVVSLEWISVEDGVHHFIVVTRDSSGLELATSVVPALGDGHGPAVVELEEARVFEVPSTDVPGPLAAAAFDTVADSGMATVPDVDGGNVFLLARRVGRETAHVVLYGTTFDEFTTAHYAPADPVGRARHEAAAAVLDLWSGLLQPASAGAAVPVEVVPLAAHRLGTRKGTCWLD